MRLLRAKVMLALGIVYPGIVAAFPFITWQRTHIVARAAAVINGFTATQVQQL
jgi:hypothetical protein